MFTFSNIGLNIKKLYRMYLLMFTVSNIGLVV